MASNRILLHICCGVCAGGAAQKLKDEGFEITGFFYNPNIRPAEEHAKRLDAAKTAAALIGFELVIDDTGTEEWDNIAEALKDEPEGGKRCELCFKLRLEKTSAKAKALGIPLFTTTLTISPHKNSSVINRIGAATDPRGFLEKDFKKADGFKKAIEFAKKNGIYRQNFCGCAGSRIKKNDK